MQQGVVILHHSTLDGAGIRREHMRQNMPPSRKNIISCSICFKHVFVTLNIYISQPYEAVQGWKQQKILCAISCSAGQLAFV